MIRAIFEGIAYNSRWILGVIEKFIKQEMNPIHMVGGGANSNVWCQIYADVLNRTIHQVKDPIQTNSRGAAFLASVGLGYITFEDIPKYVEFSNTYEPNPKNRDIYNELFKEFKNFYKRNKKMYRRLNG